MASTPIPNRQPGRGFGVLVLITGFLALGLPFMPGKLSLFLVGLLILCIGVYQNLKGFSVRGSASEASWFSRGGASILTGLLLMALPRLTFSAMAILLGFSWVLSGASLIVSSLGRRAGNDWFWSLVDGLVNVVLGIAIAVQWPIKGIVSMALFVGIRYVSAGWTLLMGAPRGLQVVETETVGMHPDQGLGLAPHPYLAKLREELTNEEGVRGRNDRYWVLVFLLVFFFVHIARMSAEWNLIGLLSPFGAVIGDVLIALVMAYGMIAPVSVTWRRLTRGLERRAWTRYLARVDQGAKPRFGSGLTLSWLTGRMRGAIRRSQAQGSATAAVGWGLRVGLPLTAILIAVVPLWGVSWFFNTETWVAGAWEMYAEHRTDTWRVEMVEAVQKEYGEEGKSPDFFRVFPEGVEGKKDFSFIVIGDTGEGDASQLVLHEQLLLVGQKPEVKFLVVSSDVIYPSGAMRHYEPKFYLPFKGFHKPIYAVPGNHDWYDALDAFTANFLEPRAARVALRARREAEHGLTTTTEAKIDGMIKEAARLRDAYQIRAAGQRAPYFEIQADDFALVVVDTGIQRTVDANQFRWLEGALDRSSGKFKMTILGHPLYAAGHYQADEDEDFGRVHRLLKKHAVDVNMAGDTHDFEFYKEPYEDAGRARSLYHFVNGGGGAYLSIGTALSWPPRPPTEECGFYPRADALTASLDAHTPTWKRPLWFWVQRFGAWPSSPEGVASAFNYDQAPFFQSFMEVRVERSTNTVRYWLYGANGRLRWRDLHVQADKTPGNQAMDDLVEFAFPLRP